MSAFNSNSPIKRRVAEPVLAVLTIFLATGIVNESVILFNTILELLWFPVAILVPGLLALSVLVGMLAHGIRLSSTVLGSGNRIQPGDTAITRVLASIVLGTLAAFTLLWVVASLYIHYLADTGGVSPSIWALLFGGGLGVLVLLRAVFFQLFPEGPFSRLRGPSVE
ncbi:hypothetical protein C487_18988 [Natrinema pallidum DSM 3751]|uniref:Uncharacterized protein n=1 Tax=Natrinema pallidum DSM 3751 TaxID=1227495 RepID=L9YDY1_9EURY|nr:hypothetical protein [Natrinema pallidum]ELY72299.1 hypothetical protein C487_18988 [Natrinema pallidum DSM 3751]